MSEFNLPTIQDVKDIIEGYTENGQPVKCSNEDAQAVLDNWYHDLPDMFYDYVKSEYMEGEIFNPEDESDE